MHSVHLDLACKLQQYSLYVGAMIDGDSRLCCVLRSMCTKLTFVVFMSVYLPCVLEYGLPDQLVTDKGAEWDLAAFTQLAMQAMWYPHRLRMAHKYTTSTRNVRPSLPLHRASQALTLSPCLLRCRRVSSGSTLRSMSVFSSRSAR